jgi:hypothetical protein
MDKREIAANLILRAVKLYVHAENNIDYIQAILLAGASIGITEPLLKENQTKTSTAKSAEVIIKVNESEIYREGHRLIVEQGMKSLSKKERNAISKSTRFFDRGVYNSLKHTGNEMIDLKASDDLVIDADFKLEAEEIIFDAVDDFNSLKLPEEIIKLLNCGDPMGIIPEAVARDRINS